MTGRGGNGPPSFPPDEIDCARLRFNSTLTNIDEDVAATVVSGTVLDVTLFSDGTAAVVAADGRRLGSVTSNQLSVLLKCLREDGPFEAEIVKLEGGWIEVNVRHA
jgi:hypothetical protein